MISLFDPFTSVVFEMQFICRSSISYKGFILSQWDRRKNDFKFSYQSCKNYFFYLSLFISNLDIELLCIFLLGLFRSLNSIYDVINSWLFIFIHWSDEIENQIRSKWLLLFVNFFSLFTQIHLVKMYFNSTWFEQKKVLFCPISRKLLEMYAF